MTTKTPTLKDWQSAREALRATVTSERKRAFPTGRALTCPACGKKALMGVEDIQRRLEQGGLVAVYCNLHGARCNECGTEYLEAYEQISLEAEALALYRSHHRATVSNVGGKKIGTYWPKEVENEMHLAPKDTLEVQVIDHDTMVIHRTGHTH